MTYSLYGPSKTIEDTEKALKNILPVPEVEGSDKVYRIAYVVHVINSGEAENVSQFIGLITLRSLSPAETTSLPRAGHASTPSTLSLELAYMFLPNSWGNGYATESILAMFDACARAPSAMWAPYEKVYVRAIVNNENIPSQRVMTKCGMSVPEVLEFEGDRLFIGGKWMVKHRLFVYGRGLVG
ncbi:GNAT domain-containing protein [Phaeosphaeriaceae sp. PMI808]|nr:GNAT domain-containing protein [Phaeosphaeriaceae sp. PMI808]